MSEEGAGGSRRVEVTPAGGGSPAAAGPQSLPRRNTDSTATNNADPTTDQSTGNCEWPTCTTKTFGRCSFAAIHTPSVAPMKPSTTDVTHLACEYRASDAPMEPQMPAMMSNTIQP